MASEERHKHKQYMAEAPLKLPLVQPPEPEDSEGEGGARISPMKMIGFMFLTFNLAMAVSLWHRGFGGVSFLVFSFLDLATLFHCLLLYAKSPPRSLRRELLKMAAWLLTTMLTIAIFQLLELWFLTMGETENPITDFQKPRRMA